MARFFLRGVTKGFPRAPKNLAPRLIIRNWWKKIGSVKPGTSKLKIKILGKKFIFIVILQGQFLSGKYEKKCIRDVGSDIVKLTSPKRKTFSFKKKKNKQGWLLSSLMIWLTIGFYSFIIITGFWFGHLTNMSPSPLGFIDREFITRIYNCRCNYYSNQPFRKESFFFEETAEKIFREFVSL